MFRFLKRNDSEVITPEVVDVPVMTIQSSIVNKNPGLPADAVKIGRNELFVACPPSQLNNPEVRPYCVPALCLWYSHSQYVGRRVRGQSV